MSPQFLPTLSADQLFKSNTVISFSVWFSFIEQIYRYYSPLCTYKYTDITPTCS